MQPLVFSILKEVAVQLSHASLRGLNCPCAPGLFAEILTFQEQTDRKSFRVLQYDYFFFLSLYYLFMCLHAFLQLFTYWLIVRKHTVSVYQAFNGIYFIILRVSSVLQKISGTEGSRVLQWYTRGIDWSADFCNNTCRSAR